MPTPQNAPEPEPEFIHLFDSTGTKLLDSVATGYEDSFCLETFGDLVKIHQECDPCGTKSFIIARVQTWDHKQPDKAFYSYYNAFHLNKILFQTQVYLGKKLIHRLHVLNPLTNTDIIGNVLYFIVKPLDGAENSNKTTANGIEKTVVENENGETIESSQDLTEGDGEIRIVTEKRPSKPSPLSISSPRRLSLMLKSPTVAEVESGKMGSWTLSTQVVSEVKDDSANPSSPGKRSLEKAARKMSTSAKTAVRRLSVVLSPTVGKSNFQPLEESDLSSSVLQNAFGPSSPTRNTQSLPRSVNEGDVSSRTRRSQTVSTKDGAIITTTTTTKPRRHSSYQSQEEETTTIINKQPTGPLHINNHRRNKTAIPVGSVTRFAVPVSKDELQRMGTPERRRRILSFSNSDKTSVEEWAKTLKDGGDLSSSNSRKSPATITEENEESGILVTTITPATPPPSAGSEGSKTVGATAPTIKAYEATLFATDNDFLESSKTRTIFKDNALAADDAALFEMPPYTGQEEMPVVVFNDDDLLCEVCYPSPQRLATMSPCMQIFHQCKCYFLVLGLAFAVILYILMVMGNPANSQTTSNST